MLTYSFTNIGTDSLYEHLYKLIKNDITAGILPAGYKLPSKRSFAKNLNISTITVENAYAQLVAEGYIYSIPKKGYFVSRLKDSFIRPLYTHASDTQAASSCSPGEPLHAASKVCAAINETSKSDPLSAEPSVPLIADFINNNINQESFPFTIWAKLMRETLADKREKLMTATPGIGSPELRAAIAKHLQDFRGMNVNPEHIIVGAGTEYLYSIIIQLLGRELTYAVEEPGYRKISHVYSSNDVKLCYIPLDKTGIDLAALEGSGADVLHLSPSHHFPTGIVTPVSKRYELLGWAARAAHNQRYIIEDDYDSEFRLMGRPIPSLQSIDVMERVIYMNSFSKSLTSTIRISYMILPSHLMVRYRQLLSFYACTVSTFEQYTLTRFISEGYFEKHINRMRNYYRNLRDILVSSIKNSSIAPICTIMEEDAGLHFLLKIDTLLTDAEIKTRAKKKGILVSCLSDYYHTPEDAQQHILIINYSGLDETAVTSAVEALETCF